ncbi:hypothetical protein C731_1340 [Mycolicibacterium hassiacum DSM 44199]|uniref:Uncharacterized protein n=1 Tax=Mycolicibacterium hassiacum (strain DSM 44199 / CIP 105218 / JCM 12690 / 3849) TaxID=1122247 RepID=K5B914_MYCHD|nr:hypothetical protein C731_1340 [Mycolicibacterium hassiacum DSM 44199]
MVGDNRLPPARPRRADRRRGKAAVATVLATGSGRSGRARPPRPSLSSRRPVGSPARAGRIGPPAQASRMRPPAQASRMRP